MEKKLEVYADDKSNPRLESIAKPALQQALNDLVMSLKKYKVSYKPEYDLNKSKPADPSKLKNVESATKAVLPDHFKTVFEKFDGGLMLQNFAQLSCDQICEATKDLSSEIPVLFY